MRDGELPPSDKSCPYYDEINGAKSDSVYLASIINKYNWVPIRPSYRRNNNNIDIVVNNNNNNNDNNSSNNNRIN